MKRSLLLLGLLVLAEVAMAAPAREPNPFEARAASKPRNRIDRAVRALLRERRIAPAAPCTDDVFVRRIYLDVIGRLPTPGEVAAFRKDRRKKKREALIDDLLARVEFADYWSLKWCDLLRVKAEFPINLWPNAVQAYHRWIHDAIRRNLPYDRFVRLLLTSSGSNFRVPAVNFYRAVASRQPEGLARAVALTFMGCRAEKWPEEKRKAMAAFFARVAYKRTKEWKEEIVYLGPPPAKTVRTTFPDGTPALISPDEDPRELFADWLVTARNPWFTRNVANRVWAWLMGRGVIDEPDDIRPDNPPSNPKLLDVLCEELVKARYDLKKLYRLILTSATYQQSPIPKSDRPDAEALFAHYIVRRLPAEVLIDAICDITGSHERYMSAIPEPFTFVPEEQRTILLSDGSITSPFLEMFGRPARDTGLESERSNRPTGSQRLHLLNSRDIQQRIDRSLKLGKMLLASRNQPGEAVKKLYVLILSREPTAGELAAITEYARTSRLSPKQLATDLVWALINTKEFLYRH